MASKPMHDLPPDEEIARLVRVNFFVNGHWNARHEHYDLYKGLDRKTIRELIVQEALKQAEEYRQVKALKESGLRPTDISRRVDHAVSVVRGWVERGRLPKRLRGLLVGKLGLVKNDFAPPREESLDLAYLFGQSLGRLQSGTDIFRRPEVVTRYEVVAHRFVDAAAEVFGKDSRPGFKEHSVYPYYSFVDSIEFTRYFDEVTLGGKVLPWQHLGTPAEYYSLLEGFFSTDVIQERVLKDSDNVPDDIRRTQRKKQNLLEELAVLLHSLGGLPYIKTIGANSVTTLKVDEPVDLENLIAQGCFHESTEILAHRVIKGRLVKINAGSLRHGRDELEVYARYRNYVGQGMIRNHATVRVAEELGIPYGTVCTWMNPNKNDARAMQRKKILEGLAAKKPDGELMCYLFRNLGMSVKEARTLATVYKMGEFEKTREEYDASGSSEELFDWMMALKNTGGPDSKSYDPSFGVVSHLKKAERKNGAAGKSKVRNRRVKNSREKDPRARNPRSKKAGETVKLRESKLRDLPPDERLERLAILAYSIAPASGAKQKALEEYTAIILAEADRYRRIKGQYETTTMSIRVIAERTGLDQPKVTRWITAGVLPRSLEVLDVGKRGYDKYVLSESREENVLLAQIFGLVVARPGNKHGILTRLTLQTDDEVERDTYLGSVNGVFGLELEARKSSNFEYYVDFHSSALAREVEDTTAGLTSIPWEHIGTHDEYYGLLRCFLHMKRHANELSSEPRRISFEAKKGIAEGLVMILYELGMTPGITPTGEDFRVVIDDPADVQQLVDNDCVTGKTKKLAEAVVKTYCGEKNGDGTVPPEYLESMFEKRKIIQGYERLQKVLADRKKGRTIKDIAVQVSEETGISFSTVQGWCYKKPPKIVQRRVRIEEIAKTHPDPKVVNHAYRNLNAEPEQARELGRQYRFEEYSERLSSLQGSHAEISNADILKQLLPEPEKKRILTLKAKPKKHKPRAPRAACPRKPAAIPGTEGNPFGVKAYKSHHLVADVVKDGRDLRKEADVESPLVTYEYDPEEGLTLAHNIFRDNKLLGQHEFELETYEAGSIFADYIRIGGLGIEEHLGYDKDGNQNMVAVVEFDIGVRRTAAEMYEGYEKQHGRNFVQYLLNQVGVINGLAEEISSMEREALQNHLDKECPLTMKIGTYNIQLKREALFRLAAYHELDPAAELDDTTIFGTVEDFVWFMGNAGHGKKPLHRVTNAATVQFGSEYMRIERTGLQEFVVTHLGSDPSRTEDVYTSNIVVTRTKTPIAEPDKEGEYNSIVGVV